MARAMVSTRARLSSSDSADRSLEINFMENHISKFNEFKESNEKRFPCLQAEGCSLQDTLAVPYQTCSFCPP